MAKRHFISLEGGEGAGKSTQARLLAARLRTTTGKEVVLTREPGGAPGAEAIRRLLVEGAADRWSPRAEALLNYAARDEHLRHTILPALARGAYVITDRFADSTRAYQGIAGGVDADLISALEQAVIGETWPALTLVLDLAPQAGLDRAAARGGGEGRFEAKGLAYHQQLRQAFLSHAAADPQRCLVIDAQEDQDIVATKIWEAVASRLLD
ncbi:dTMP kinase [Rhodoligotrophos appendicifer]|uniref:dTMP kinase n=1 Tax=Rhodoligotrophos appendicifer TaxID=987056 RepID=UPI001184E2CB|nr:dTMP kinase [Rhodoligotrophos appendicifer]